MKQFRATRSGIDFLVIFIMLVLGVVRAGGQGLWSPVVRPAEVSGISSVSSTASAPDAWIRPIHGTVYDLDITTMRGILAEAPWDDEPDAVTRAPVVTLPIADGEFSDFRVLRGGVVDRAHAQATPEMLTFRAEQVDGTGMKAVLDLTPLGFHGMVFGPEGTYFIDPYSRGNETRYSLYSRKGYARSNGHAPEWSCSPTRRPGGVERGNAIRAELARQRAAEPISSSLTDAGQSVVAMESSQVGIASTPVVLRSFRLAVTADAAFTSFHGGRNSAQAAIVTGINRVSGIFERDLAVRLTLVANNINLVYSTNPSMGFGDITALITSVIGVNAYDVGHFVSGLNNGGLAGFGVVCDDLYKGDGESADSQPLGDPFWVDYVAHEIGHQFGAGHTFNATSGSCGGGNRDAASAYEPGSGSTIMAYAGLCSPNNIQSLSDAYFHAGSMKEIQDYLAFWGDCALISVTANTHPTANAGGSFTIPSQTPFVLTGVGFDANGDALTFCWEQMDLGSAQSLSNTPNTTSPLFRSLSPSASPTRYFPALATVLANTTDNKEKLPVASRAMNFRFTVRDNRVGQGGVARADTIINAVNTGAAFAVTSPTTAVTWSGTRTITWNVSGTTSNGINTSLVDILLSSDGGQTFPHVLANSTPNDGSESIILPNINTSQARVMVRPVGNIYYAVNPVAFTVQPGLPASAVFAAEGSGALNDTVGTGNGNGRLDPGERGIPIFFTVRNNGGVTATGVSGQLSVVTSGAFVMGPTTRAFADVASLATTTHILPFYIGVDASFPCGTPIQVTLAMQSTQGSTPVSFSFITGPTCLAPAPVSADSDGDGLPDLWELEWFGGHTFASPTLDSDLDGHTNREEYIADTNPLSSGSVLRLLATGEGATSFSFPSSSNRSYRIEFSPQLVSPAWVDVPPVLQGSGGALIFQPVAPSSGVYRVVVEWPITP